MLPQNRSIRRARRVETWRNPSAWRSGYARLVPSVRHRFVREPWTKPAVALHLSAAVIQALWRGSAQRQRVKRAAARGLNTAATSKVDIRHGGLRGRGGGMGYYMRRRGPRGSIYVRFDDQRGGRGGESEFEHKVDHDVMFRAWAACRMQAWWRMVATRWRYRYNHYTMYHIAASVVQRVWRKRLHYLREAGLIKLHARRASMRQSSEQSSEHPPEGSPEHRDFLSKFINGSSPETTIFKKANKTYSDSDPHMKSFF